MFDEGLFQRMVGASGSRKPKIEKDSKIDRMRAKRVMGGKRIFFDSGGEGRKGKLKKGVQKLLKKRKHKKERKSIMS